jgi:hypothetical protein
MLDSYAVLLGETNYQLQWESWRIFGQSTRYPQLTNLPPATLHRFGEAATLLWMTEFKEACSRNLAAYSRHLAPIVRLRPESAYTWLSDNWRTA